MGKRFAILIGVVAAVAVALPSQVAAKLVGDYQFNNSLSPSVGTLPAMADIGAGNLFAAESPAGCTRPVRTFPADSGFQLNTAAVVPQDRYTVIMQFRSTLDVDSFTRLLAFPNPPNDDDGLYLYQGKLNIYNGDDPISTDHEGSTIITPDQYVEVAFTRTASGVLTAYLNGQPEATYTEIDNDALLDAGRMIFFKDNGTEDDPGAISRVRLYDAALPADQITNTVGCIAPVTCGGDAVTTAGTAGSNILVGTSRRDVIAGLGGNDTIRGLGGGDILCGGKGRDRLLGGPGRDRLIGAKGRDTCRGGKARDIRRGCELARG